MPKEAQSQHFFDHRLFEHRCILNRSTRGRECCHAVAAVKREAESAPEQHRASFSESTYALIPARSGRERSLGGSFHPR